MRERRVDLRLSQRTVSEQIGLSRDQLNRIERAQITPRFAATWTFCELTDTNPLWLGFAGALYPEPWGFAPADVSHVPAHAPFREAMLPLLVGYDRLRAHYVKMVGRPRIRFMSGLGPFRIEPIREIKLASPASSPKVPAMHVADISSWEELRARLIEHTSAPGAKATFARTFGVSIQVLSQWISGTSSPKADMALRLRYELAKADPQIISPNAERVAAAGPQQKKRAGKVRQHSPALKTQKGKSTSHEKTKSGPYKKR